MTAALSAASAGSPPPPAILPLPTADWLVIGGGPLGTIGVAVMLNHGIKDILWIDPSFERMGRLGERYGGVPANTRNDRLVRAMRKLGPAVDFDADQARRRAADKTAALLIDAPPLGVAGPSDPGLAGDAGAELGCVAMPPF